MSVLEVYNEKAAKWRCDGFFWMILIAQRVKEAGEWRCWITKNFTDQIFVKCVWWNNFGTTSANYIDWMFCRNTTSNLNMFVGRDCSSIFHVTKWSLIRLKQVLFWNVQKSPSLQTQNNCWTPFSNFLHHLGFPMDHGFHLHAEIRTTFGSIVFLIKSLKWYGPLNLFGYKKARL